MTKRGKRIITSVHEDRLLAFVEYVADEGGTVAIPGGVRGERFARMPGIREYTASHTPFTTLKRRGWLTIDRTNSRVINALSLTPAAWKAIGRTPPKAEKPVTYTVDEPVTETPQDGLDYAALANALLVRVMEHLNTPVITPEVVELRAQRADLTKRLGMSEKNNSTLMNRIAEQETVIAGLRREIEGLRARREPMRTPVRELLSPEQRNQLASLATG